VLIKAISPKTTFLKIICTRKAEGTNISHVTMIIMKLKASSTALSWFSDKVKGVWLLQNGSWNKLRCKAVFTRISFWCLER